MSNDYLLDTNTAIRYLNGNTRVVSLVDEKGLHFLPFITVAELLYGAKGSARHPETCASITNTPLDYAILSDMTTKRKAKVALRGTPLRQRRQERTAVPPKRWTDYCGIISPEEAEQMIRDVEEAFEKVDAD